MATYSELAQKVRSWSNREGTSGDDVLSYSDVKDFLNYGVDEAYRTLRIAPLEAIRSYTISDPDDGQHKLTIPSDLIEIIQVRKQSEENSDQFPSRGYDVFQAKADVLSFYDQFLNQYGQLFYTRERNDILVSPAFKDSEVYEVYYYRRLPELDARYTLNLDTEGTSTQWYQSSDDAADIAAFMAYVETQEGDTEIFNTDPDLENLINDSDGNFRLGKLTPNWLRDNNEKIVLFGALMEAGSFLDDERMEQRYMNKFEKEINKLNTEDNMRRVTGGHIQQRFTARGLI